MPDVTEQTLFVNYCFPVLTYQRATQRVVTGAHRSVSLNLELCQGGKAVDIDLKHRQMEKLAFTLCEKLS